MKTNLHSCFSLSFFCFFSILNFAQTSDQTPLPEQFTGQNLLLPTSFKPDWNWAKSGNGTGTEWGMSVSVDRWGSSYLLGSYNSPTINFSGNILTNASSSYDIFLIKYDLHGNILWAKTFGSARDDFANEVVTDSTGNIFIGGSFYSNTLTFGSYTLTNTLTNNTADIFLVKLNSNGDVMWAKSAGGIARDVLIGMDVDSIGNSYITGSYVSSSITFGSTTLTNTNGNEEVFIAKYDFGGNPLWAKSGNGGGVDWGNGIAIDGLGNCYATGSFAGSNISFSGNILTNSNTDGSSDIYVVKYNTIGAVVWAKKWGGSGEDVGLEIDVSRDGKCYLTGPYQSSSLVFESNTLTNSNTSTEDIFIAKLNQVGNAVWAKSGNGNGSDTPSDISLDEFENIFVAGSFRSYTIFFGDSTLTNVSLSDTADIFLVKYNSEGNLIWTSKAGGDKSDIGSSIAVYNPESYFLGGTYGTNNLSLGGTLLPNSGSFDVFIAYSGNIVEQPIISATPPFHGVPATSGSVVFDVYNIGNGNMNWSAVSSDPSWLTITSGGTGTNYGQIQVSYQANSGDYRVDSIIIAAPSAVNSPFIVEVRQSAFGSDWIVKTSGTKETLNDVKFIGDQLGWVVGNNGLILHTTESGNTWIKQSSPTNVKLTKVFFIDSLKGWAVGDSGIILKTTNGGNSWEIKNSLTTVNFTGLQFLNENIGWAAGDRIIIRTSDGGNSWLSSGNITDIWNITSIHFRDQNNGIIGSTYNPPFGGSQKLLKTTDGGVTWTSLYPPMWYGTITLSFADDLIGILKQYFFDGPGNVFYRTSDGGETWKHISTYSRWDYYYLGCFHINSFDHAWILDQLGTSAIYSSDNGATWGSQYVGLFDPLGGPPNSGFKSITSFDSTLAWAVGIRGMILRYQKTPTSKYLRLITPNGGNTFRAGGTMNITWTSIGIDQVNLCLQDWYPCIAENIPANQGSYLWQIPLNQTWGNKILIRSNSFDQMIDVSDNYFTMLPACFSWSFVDSTGNNSSITVPINISSAIGDDSLEIGDFIGVFYHRNDSLICGGYGIWKGEDFVLTAWGDSAGTSIKDGFYEGEEMVFKIFKPHSCKEYFADVTYQTGSSTYTTNGNYTLNSLKGINGVRVTLEGFYNYNTTTDWLRMKDTVSAYLRNTYSPYNIVDSAKSLLDTLGFVANFNFLNVTNGDYYLVIKHRNSIETWSSTPITFTNGNFNVYNFTDDSSKAYGNNMKMQGSKWCIYSGDVDGNGIVDVTDLVMTDIDNLTFMTGYRNTDINGDGIIDVTDLALIDANNLKFVHKIIPTSIILEADKEQLNGTEMNVE